MTLEEFPDRAPRPPGESLKPLVLLGGIGLHGSMGKAPTLVIVAALSLAGAWFVVRFGGWEPGSGDSPERSDAGAANTGGSGAVGEPRVPGKSSHVPVSPGSGALYSGPGELADWTTDREGAWRVEDGALVATGGGGAIRREFSLPPQARLSFVLQGSERAHLRVILASDGESATPDNAYDLNLLGSFAYLRKRWLTKRNGGSRIVGQVKLGAIGQEGSGEDPLRVGIVIDRANGRIGLEISPENDPGEGTGLHFFEDPNPEVGEFGDWLQFVAEKDKPLRLSAFRIEPWKEAGAEEGNSLAPDAGPP